MINTVRLCLLIPALFLLSCSDDHQSESATSDTHVETVQSKTDRLKPALMSVAGIPEKSVERQQRVFQNFEQRTRIADYLLAEEYAGDAELEVRLLQARNKQVIELHLQNTTANAVPDEAVQAFYEEHSDRFAIYEYSVAHILIRERNQDAIAETLMAISERLDAGESFEVLVLDYSEDMASKNNNGVLDAMRSDSGAREIIEVVSRLEPGEISVPVQTRRGTQIFKLLEKNTAGAVEFESVKAKVRYQLEQQAKTKELERLAKIASQELNDK